MGKPDQEPLSTDPVEIETRIERVRHNQLAEQDYRLLERLLRLLLNLAHVIEQKNTSLARLKRLLFGPKSDPPSPPLQQQVPVPPTLLLSKNQSQQDMVG